MFTRDISLEDCILDLIDNSIDGLIKSRNLDISSSLLNGKNRASKTSKLPTIKVSYSDTEFTIADECGGIPLQDALDDAFNFGHAAGESSGSLGVYGIGLKRAIFKIGELFEIKSHTTKDGFSIDLDVKKWAQKDSNLKDWTIPLTPKGGVLPNKAGTVITIRRLRPEVAMLIKAGGMDERLRRTVSKTYGLFLDRFVRIKLNGTAVEPFHIPIGESAEVTPAHDEFQDGDVRVRLFASLAARGPNQEWRGDVAGWYALCNGRIVVAADKTDLTGWGTIPSESGFLPQFHSGKFRGFIGVAFFESTNPLALPWTTTKRGLNRESPVYLRARNRMRGIARPIITFLDSLYKAEAPEETTGRNIADAVKATNLSTIAAQPQSTFSVTPRGRTSARATVSIQFEADRRDVDRVRKHIKHFKWGANKIGSYTFEHYLKTECPE